MSSETLRQLIIEMQRPLCKGEPNAHAIANYLAAMKWYILKNPNEADQQDMLNTYHYKSIEVLRQATTDLIYALKNELSENDWNTYFTE